MWKDIGWKFVESDANKPFSKYSLFVQKPNLTGKRLLSRVMSFALIVVLTGVVVSCKGGDGNSLERGAKNDNVLRIDINAAFSSLDPASGKHTGSNFVFPLIYSYLFLRDNNGELKPDLAGNQSYDPRTSTWTIRLKNNIFFHNHQMVTAKDVRYSIEQALDKSDSAISSRIRDISLETETTLCIHLKKDDPDFLNKISEVEIIPDNSRKNRNFFFKPVGSGPFRFISRKANEQINLAPNTDYYDAPASLEGVIFNYQPNKEKSWTRLLEGKADIAHGISPKNYEIMRKYEENFRFDRYPMMSYAIMLFNNSDPLFADKRVREALSRAIDREYIASRLLNGYAGVANGPMGVDSLYHDPSIKPVLYNPREAIEILKEADWSYDARRRRLSRRDEDFEFTLFLFRESQIEKKVARYIQLSLNQLGIKVHLKALPHKELYERYHENTRFQAVLTNLLGAYSTPANIEKLWCPDNGRKAGAGGFRNAEACRLTVKAMEEKDPLARKKILHHVEALILSFHPGVFLYQQTGMDAMSRRFHLPHPFSLSIDGLRALKDSRLQKD